MQRQPKPGSMPARAAGAALGWLVLLFVPFSAAHAQSPASIAVEGNRRIEAATIRGYLQAAAGTGSDAAGIEALLATGLFDAVKIDHSGGQTVIRVAEAPPLRRVVFEGNRRGRDEELSALVQSKPGGTLQRALVQGDAERIREIYRRTGRDGVKVVPLTVSRSGERTDLVFEIVEG